MRFSMPGMPIGIMPHVCCFPNYVAPLLCLLLTIWHNGFKSGVRTCGPGTFLPSETFSGSGGHASNDSVPDNPNINVPNN